MTAVIDQMTEKRAASLDICPVKTQLSAVEAN